MRASRDPILAAFSARSARRGAPPVVVCGARSLRAHDLEDLAARCDAALAPLDLAGGEIIGLSATHAPGFLAALLALRRRRVAALLLDATSPRGEKRRIASGMGARAILSCRGRWPSRASGYRVAGLGGVPTGGALAGDIAVVKLTSGSTGSPQGILATCDALLADEDALARTMSLEGDERILAAVPLAHSYGLSSIALPALVRGATVVVSEDTTPVGPMLTASQQGVTFVPSVPAYLGALVRLKAPPPLPRSVRRVISAGAPLPQRTAQRFREVFGRPVHVFYGSSECGGICYDRDGDAGEAGSVGTPVAGVRVTLDPVVGGDAAGGGSVSVESPAVALSYYPQPDARLAGGRFASRDLGRWDGRRLVLVGRIDDLINVRGRNVNPREVEEVVGRVSGVDEVAAVGIAGPAAEGEVVRVVIACARGALEVDALRAWCRRHLADYKVPRSFVFVDRLPRTVRGKLDRDALRDLAPSEPRRG